jgi:hypothetical protein
MRMRTSSADLQSAVPPICNRPHERTRDLHIPPLPRVHYASPSRRPRPHRYRTPHIHLPSPLPLSFRIRHSLVIWIFVICAFPPPQPAARFTPFYAFLRRLRLFPPRKKSASRPRGKISSPFPIFLKFPQRKNRKRFNRGPLLLTHSRPSHPFSRQKIRPPNLTPPPVPLCFVIPLVIWTFCHLSFRSRTSFLRFLRFLLRKRTPSGRFE